MPRFFVDPGAISGGRAVLEGEDALHLSQALRARAGEEVVICDGCCNDFRCVIKSIEADRRQVRVRLNVLDKTVSLAEPTVDVTLFAGYAKGNKPDVIIQKAVELGVGSVVVFSSEHSVPQTSDADKKLVRWNRIALEAAKQSGRGKIPDVTYCPDIGQLTERLKGFEPVIFCYENGGTPIRDTLRGGLSRRVAVVTGPEGGFSQAESHILVSCSTVTSLGRRILRCETAPLAVLAVIMYETGNL